MKTKNAESNPTYDIKRSFEENFKNGPFVKFNLPKREVLSFFKLLDFELNSPLGIPAGLLLNSRWVRSYGSSPISPVKAHGVR
jgi:hypothetical protein